MNRTPMCFWLRFVNGGEYPKIAFELLKLDSLPLVSLSHLTTKLCRNLLLTSHTGLGGCPGCDVLSDRGFRLPEQMIAYITSVVSKNIQPRGEHAHQFRHILGDIYRVPIRTYFLYIEVSEGGENIPKILEKAAKFGPAD